MAYKTYKRAEKIKKVLDPKYIMDFSITSYLSSKYYNDNGLEFSEYICEKIDSSITYTEYLSDKLDHSVNYTEYTSGR